MDIGFITDYISPVALAICLCVGWIVKNLVPGDTVNRYIPLMAGVLGVLIVAWATWSVTPETIVAGLVSGLASTGLYEAFAGVVLGVRVAKLERDGNDDLRGEDDGEEG